MKIIGLTGGIGSGKSVVAQYLDEAGIPVIDADKIGHRLLEEDEAIRASIISAFGSEVVEGGNVSREKLAARIFAGEEARARLNALLHPAIIQTVMEECRRLYAQGHKVTVTEAALLGDGGRQEPWLDGLILVTAAVEKRAQRLVEYRHMRESDALQRIRAQSNPDDKRSIADWIINNDGDLQTLRIQVNALAAELRYLQQA